MKRIIILLFLLSVSIAGFSQTPGYLGKRFLVAGEFGSMLKLFATANHNFNEQALNFSIRGVVDVDYVTSRRGSIGFTLNMVNTATDFNYDSTSYRVVDFDTHYADYTQIKGLSYCINFKKFHGYSKGSIAPVGTYSKIGLGIIRYKAVPYVSEVEYLDKKNTERYITPLITYAYGKQRVFLNNFVFRTSVEIGLVPSGFFNALDYYYQTTQNAPQKDLIKYNANIRLASYYLVSFNIGVGFLIPVRQN